ncbi:MAG: hypothetical protein RR295_01620, partial [Oscillospiraceae bacterium]
LEKAKLIIEKESGTDSLTVQFNPAEYNLSDSASYAEKVIPGFPGPITQFIAGAASTLTLSLTFDTYDTPESGVRTVQKDAALTAMKAHAPTDVSLLTRKVINLVNIDGSLHRPPTVTFAWGVLHFKGVVTEVKHTYTMFMPSGMPVRARVELTLKSVIDVANKKRESPFESPDRTKYRTVHQGEHLWNLAVQEYGDPELWRVIAKENNLMNPLELYPGQVLKLPALTES